MSLNRVSSGSFVFRSQRGYDAASNVTAVNTTLAAGTDNQVFCYDEQNRLTWAGSSGTPACGVTLTPGSLSSASYTQTYAYDTLDRLTSGPLGNYTYGDSAHLHAATSIGTSYTASYDAVGDMTCRAADGSTTCAGTPTGAQLTYDNGGRLSHWQNAPSSPTTTDDFLYDGEGNRVEQLTTISGSPVTTVYVAGGLEEITTSGITTTLTKYFAAAGLPTVERVGTNGPLSYLASDGQGSVSETLDGSGTVTFQQLYTPYGASRYSNGSSPTTLGYTGQRADANTGLDFYQARYYDPAAGQFTSADTVNDGLNRYGYVGGNPTSNSDPSGHRICYDGDLSSCVPNGSPPPTTPPTPPTPTGSGGTHNPPPPTPTSPPHCTGDANCGCYTLCGGGNSGGDDISCGGGGSSGGFATLLNSDCGGLPSQEVQQLYDEAQRQGLNLTEWDVEAMINANPGLPYSQYELLVQLWGEGIRAYNVVEIAYAENGRLVWLDAMQLKHIQDEHWEDFRDYFSVSVEGVRVFDIVGTIFGFLKNERPERVNGDTYSYGFWDSLFDRFRGVEQTLDIVVNYQGRIITAYVPD